VVGLEVPILRKAADTLTEVVFRMNCDESDHFIIAVCVAFVGAEGRDTASLARLGVGCGRTASAVIVLCHAVFHTHAAFEFVAVAEVVVAIVTAIFFTAAAAAAAALAVALAVALAAAAAAATAALAVGFFALLALALFVLLALVFLGFGLLVDLLAMLMLAKSLNAFDRVGRVVLPSNFCDLVLLVLFLCPNRDGIGRQHHETEHNNESLHVTNATEVRENK